MKFHLFVLLLLLVHYICAYEVRRFQSSIIGQAMKSSNFKKDDKLLKWSRTELQELANIFADKILNHPHFVDTEFVEQSATKYYVDANSLDGVFKALESDGLALRTQIYEAIKGAGLLEDKGEIKEVLRVEPIFKEMSQREKDNLRITDQKVLQKIQQKNLITGTKMSVTPRRWVTVGNAAKNNKMSRENNNELAKVSLELKKMTDEQFKLEQNYLKQIEETKIYWERSQKLQKEMGDKDNEILELKRNQTHYKIESERLEKELDKKEKQLNELKRNEKIYMELNGRLEKELDKKEKQIVKLQKNNGGEAPAGGINVGGGILNKIFGGGGGGGDKKSRVQTLNSQLATKEGRMHSLDRQISTKKRKLQSIESRTAGLNNNNSPSLPNQTGTIKTVKKVNFADTDTFIPEHQKIGPRIKKVKNDESAGEADDESLVIKAPRRISTLTKRKHSNNDEASSNINGTNLKYGLKSHKINEIGQRQNTPFVFNSKLKNDESAADESEVETKVLKTPKQIVSLKKRNRSSVNSSAPNYEADTENKALGTKRSKTRAKSAIKNNGAERVRTAAGVLSPSWARRQTTNKKKN